MILDKKEKKKMHIMATVNVMKLIMFWLPCQGLAKLLQQGQMAIGSLWW